MSMSVCMCPSAYVCVCVYVGGREGGLGAHTGMHNPPEGHYPCPQLH